MKSVRIVLVALLAVGLSALSGPQAAHAKTHTVNPGDSIQAAVDAAAPGDTIKVMPGDYVGIPAGSASAAVVINKPLKLIAKSKIANGVKVRILPGAGQHHGILVQPVNDGDPDINGIIIKGFTIQGFSNNGIWLRHVQHFKIQGNETINDLENGIFPTLSANGMVKKNVSYGSQDSALWIEASENVRVFNNDLHDSPTGLEVTVSNKVQIKRNEIHDNTVGMGLYHPSAAALPPLPVMANWDVVQNHVYDNNLPNTAPPGSMAAALPSGGGILVLGVDHVTVEQNTVESNGFFGVALIDYCVAVAGTAFDCSLNPPQVETEPDDNLVKNNNVEANATDPTGPFAPIARDLILLAPSGTNNCFEDNTPSATKFFDPANQCM